MNYDKNFFRNNICFTCKDSRKQPVKHCMQCRLVPYCCREHQVADWKNHKTLCRVISSENLQYNAKNFVELQQFIQQRGLLWQVKLKRKLTSVECQMFMYPRVCAVCFSVVNLFPCAQCLSVCYCSNKHQIKHRELHEKFCKDFKLSLDMDCYFYHHSPKDVLRVKVVDMGLKETLKSLTDVLDLNQPSEYSSYLNYIHNCDQILSGLTVLYALEMTGMLTSHKLLQKTLVLHIVGANSFELSLNWTLIIEIFVHWIFNLELVDITFIGPELEDIPQLETNVKKHLCDNSLLKEEEIDINIHLHKCCYHEVANNLPKPDLVVAFNSGLHEFCDSTNDTWQNSVSSLSTHTDVPLMLTAYTFDEITKDVDIVKGTEIVWGPAKNPFSNLRPLIDWASEDDPIYFINNFLAILKKR